MGVTETKKSRLERVRARFAERLASRLFAQVTGKPVLKPGHDVMTVAASIVAGAVHLFTLGCLGLGLWMIVVRGGFGYILIGILLLCLAVLTLPSFGRLDEDSVVIDPTAAPHLYDLVGRVASRLGARPVWRIALSAEFNASFGQVGLRRRRVLVFGYALWNLLDPAERVAILAHELGHNVNGDSRRGFLIGSSLGSLVRIYALLREGPLYRGGDTSLVVGVASVLARFFMWLLSWPVLGLILIQERLIAQSTQRAEYFAEQLSVQVAGCRAAMSALDKTLLAGPCLRALHTAVIRRDPDIWAASRQWQADLNDADRASMIARAESEGHRVDASHPPTAMRIAAIDSRPDIGDPLPVAADEVATIDAELRQLLRPITEHIRAGALG